MQATTIAIGKTGVQFFAQHFLAVAIQRLLQNLHPPNRNVSVANFNYNYGVFIPDMNGGSDQTVTRTVTNMQVQLSQGQLEGYVPAFQQVSQGVANDAPVFTLVFGSSAFSAQYQWAERYHWQDTFFGDGDGDINNTYIYSVSFSQLTVTVEVAFLFDPQSKAWEIKVQETSGQPVVLALNTPAGSVLNNQTQDCSGSHISDATAQAIQAIDFTTPINALISGILASIPGSGDLGNGIVFDFSLGDSGLDFPNNDGIEMGVKGGTSYNGSTFPGTPPPPLPFPAPPADADSYHLNMYVSNYEVDALNWGYFKAGKLDLLIQPDQLPNPKALKVGTYTTFEPTLQPYAAFVMNAQITQNSAPTTSFQTAYLFDKAVMDRLQQLLPSNIDQLIQRLQGNAYASQAALEDFLNSATVPTSYFTAIENASKISAMALTQDMTFTLLIQNGQSELPKIKFGVQRVDILTNLALGINTNGNQTMQFGFANASNVASFISSSIPDFDGSTFAKIVWPVTAENFYEQNLAALGASGVPLPIMEGLQFDFANAQLSLQEGYVSILANVAYKNPSVSFLEEY